MYLFTYPGKTEGTSTVVRVQKPKADRSAEIRTALRGLTVGAVAFYLRTIFLKRKPKVDEVRFCGVDTDIDEMLQLRPHLADFKANDVMIRFFGGPPGHYSWFDGSVYTYICDKIMWCVANRETETLNEFLKSVKHHAS